MLAQFFTPVSAVLLGYVLGCLNSAYYLTRYFQHTDIRDQFSHSAGATNAGRVLGRSGFLLVLILDLIRSWLAITLGGLICGSDLYAGFLLFAVTLGHIHPLQLGGKGGKGAACLIGGVLAICWPLALILVAGSGIIYLLSRRKFSAGIVSFIALPFGLYLFQQPLLVILPATATIILVLFTYYRLHSQREVTKK